MTTDPDKARLEALDRRLAQANAARETTAPARPGAGSARAGMGARLVTELLAGVLGGLLLGWAVDRWAGISPFGLLVGLTLGVVAAGRNVWKLSRRSGGATGED